MHIYRMSFDDLARASIDARTLALSLPPEQQLVADLIPGERRQLELPDGRSN
jgi:hypothetical protein